MDTVKYDRQIRLFGVETQEKLCSMKVQVLGSVNLISAEIVKNIVLLGVGKIIISRELLDETKKLVPDSLQCINPALEIMFLDFPTECDFTFNIDIESRNKSSFYFVCSKCLSINAETHIHDCVPLETDLLEVKYCLVGALAVQEFIKFIQGKDSVKSYKVNF
ncbi:uncharacterized protein VICG_00371 [Vittaforma corneae ATCC 50505]|uniref:Uncharacterized protein n=1 Tax=Vittaforma corneae (strain ATCC 50505) TaxID=993615 RepID=L2GPV5_VITCO|nr:uncharacterized protein VICG_00371 [Vittaforma corneae ATCC 50505]ELA42619.1 hypothetical protein VICG_00371 [Vittaforma corneae ATCC 50505]